MSADTNKIYIFLGDTNNIIPPAIQFINDNKEEKISQANLADALTYKAKMDTTNHELLRAVANGSAKYSKKWFKSLKNSAYVNTGVVPENFIKEWEQFQAKLLLMKQAYGLDGLPDLSNVITDLNSGNIKILVAYIAFPAFNDMHTKYNEISSTEASKRRYQVKSIAVTTYDKIRNGITYDSKNIWHGNILKYFWHKTRIDQPRRSPPYRYGGQADNFLMNINTDTTQVDDFLMNKCLTKPEKAMERDIKLEQAIGRVFRSQDLQPVLIDIVDNSMLSNTANKAKLEEIDLDID